VKPLINIERHNNNKEWNDYPKNEASEQYGDYPLFLAIFMLSPFFEPDH
jgi:hypothetical protein